MSAGIIQDHYYLLAIISFFIEEAFDKPFKCPFIEWLRLVMRRNHTS